MPMASFEDPRFNLSYKYILNPNDTAKTKTISYVNAGASVGSLSGIADLMYDFASDAASLTGYSLTEVYQVSNRSINY